MRFVSFLVRVTLIFGVFLTGSDAFAGPVRCSVNNQDSTCVGHLTTAWQTAPTCPAQPGWTTVASAQWIGSQYSAPQCNYQAPPQCPSGWQETSGASWNGSTWGGLLCQPPPPPSPSICQYGFASGPVWNGSVWVYSCNAPPLDAEAVCMATLPADWTIAGPYAGRVGAAPAGVTQFNYSGSGQKGVVDKCGNPVLMNHLQCYVRTSDSAFISWTSMTDFGVGNCGH